MFQYKLYVFYDYPKKYTKTEWIEDNNGEARVIEKVAIRFDREKMKELLEQSEHITDINCD